MAIETLVRRRIGIGYEDVQYEVKGFSELNYRSHFTLTERQQLAMGRPVTHLHTTYVRADKVGPVIFGPIIEMTSNL